MKTVKSKDKVKIFRTKDDPKYYKETTLWHAIKKELLERGDDVIKKLMYKDGHMVDEHEYYIRDRKWKYCYRHINFHKRFLWDKFNKEGEVILSIWKW